MKKRFSFLLAFSMVITSISVYFTIKTDILSKKDISDKINLCLTTKWVVGSILPNGVKYSENKEEISAKLDCLSYFSKKINNINELTKSVNAIVASTENNSKNSILCHDFLHELGSYSYLKFKDESLKEGFDSCGWGYYHGAMVMSLKNINKNALENLIDDCSILAICLSGEKNIDKNEVHLKIKDLIKLCYKLSNETNMDLINNKESEILKYSEIDVEDNNEFIKPYYIDYSKFTFCGHGIGHAIGESFDNLDDIAKNCSLLYSKKDDPFYNIVKLENGSSDLKNKLSYHKIDDECFSGAMNAVMERIIFRGQNIIFENIVINSYNNIENIINECFSYNTLKDSYIQNCIRYAIAYSKKIKLSESINFCNNLQKTNSSNVTIDGCYEGVGHKAFLYYYKYLSNEYEKEVENIIFRNKIGSVGRLMNLTCSLDLDNNCVSRFTLETIQTIRDIDEMKEICKYLSKDIHKRNCFEVVDYSLKS